MTDLRQARTPNPNAGIDAVGWLFSALVAVIIAVAGLIAYEANATRANAPVSRVKSCFAAIARAVSRCSPRSGARMYAYCLLMNVLC
jgi:hypothetical protein